MDTNVDITTYTISDDVELNVSDFFRKVTALLWTSKEFIRYHKTLDPYANHSALLHTFKIDLQKIKGCENLPRSIRSLAGTKNADKKGKCRTYSSGNIFINSPAIAFGSVHTINSYGASTLAAAPASISTTPSSPPHQTSEAEYETRSPTSSLKRTYSRNLVPGDDLSCLYSYMYQLYKKQPVDLSQLETSGNDSLLSLLKNGCIKNMKKFNTLDREQRSYLHVLLSGCINTISAKYRLNLINIIGQDKLTTTLQLSRVSQFTNYRNEVWVQLKEKIKEKYRQDGKSGLRCYVIEQRSKIYKSNSDRKTDLTLKILDAFEFILNMVDYKEWDDSDLNEEDYGLYWKSIIAILLRGTEIKLKRGESSCLASKFERQINEHEYGDTSAYIMGRRMDLLAVIKLHEDKNKEITVELGSVEIKPEGVDDGVQVIQLNKNVRVNKSILHLLLLHMGLEEDVSDVYTIGVDIIGLHGFLYRVLQYEDVVVAVKLSENNMFLPGDDDDLFEFIESDTLDQLLFYVEHLLNLNNNVKKGSKKYKRVRANAKTTNNIHPRLLSPPRRNPPFPPSTFFTPKRTNEKNKKANETVDDNDLQLSEEE